MKLIDNWKDVLKESLALWAAYAGGAFAGVDLTRDAIVELLPVLEPMLPPNVYAWLSFVCLVLIPALRLIDQGLAKVKASGSAT